MCITLKLLAFIIKKLLITFNCSCFSVRTAELNVQMKSTKSQVDLAKQELIDYKDKATRILQSKDKLIASLKEGSTTGTLAESAVSSAELESAKQEIAMLKEEIQHNRMTIENLRADIQVCVGVCKGGGGYVWSLCTCLIYLP